MKLLRCGNKGSEKPAALDKNGKIKDLSSHISDLNIKNINFEILSKLQKIDLGTLPEVSSSTRIGPCVSQPGKFVGIGLNYSDHAAKTGAKPPSEPIIFMKATAEAPFGGIKQTGYGREGVFMGIKDYLNIKYIHLGITG